MINHDELKSMIKGRVAFDEPLFNYSTMRVGGPADAIVWPEGLKDLQTLISYFHQKKIDYFVTGAGSNVLFLDGGFRGVVIILRENFSEIKLTESHENLAFVVVQAGALLGRFVSWCIENGLGGIEFLATIPGTIGGAISMNAGWKDKEIEAFIESIKVIDGTGKIFERQRTELEFSYRKLAIPRRQIILEARFKLPTQGAEVSRKIIEEQREYRKATQPLEYPNLGSIFMNPLALKGKGRIAAGKLIEDAGLKGVRVRGAKVSDQHANFIVNVGEAKATDVMALISMVKEKVKEDSGITLETEVVICGEEV